MSVRNFLFDAGWLNSVEYPLPVISIGNITVGGTGKTPLTEYIIRLLKDKYSVAFLSRGYKRKTKGVIIAGALSTAAEIGDEPKQIQTKFPEITVAVAEKRTEGIEQLLHQTLPEVIVLDDAFQHRYVKPGFQILIVDYNRPLWNDYTFPAGELREPRKGKKRADVIVVNKCPSGITVEEKKFLIKKLKPEHHQQVFFTTVEYLNPVNVSGSSAGLSVGSSVIALAGIARPEPFFEYLARSYNVLDKVIYPDHYSFTKKDYLYVRKKLDDLKGKEKAVITTEKDKIRLENMPWMDDEFKRHLWYVPIKLKFLFNEQEKFNQLIYSYVEKNKKDS